MVMHEEKRRHPRLEDKLPFTIGAEKVEILTQTKNISCSGAYCAVDRVLPAMSKVMVSMTIPVKQGSKVLPKKITCEGVVLRCNPPEKDQPQIGWNAAIMFNDISEKNKNIIADYVQQQLVKTIR